MPRKSWNPKNTRAYATDEERRMSAYKDWMEGMTYPAIAEKYEYSDRQSAMRAVKLARKTMVEDVAEARDQATERIMGPLLAMRAAAMPGKVVDPETGEEIARPGDPAAAGQYKGLEERLAKLWGLDKPVQIETTGDSIQRIILDPRVLGIDTGGTDQP